MHNNKIFLLGALLVGLAIGFVASNGAVTGFAAGGQGKAQGDSCMKGCMDDFGIYGEWFDKQSDLTQFCLTRCNPAESSSACGVHSDNCCVPFTADPDCSGTAAIGCGNDIIEPGEQCESNSDCGACYVCQDCSCVGGGGTSITGCGTTINTPGTYCVAQDLNCGLDAGIVINTSDVTLNCNGHSITGSGSNTGIKAGFTSLVMGIISVSNVTVNDCVVSDFGNGISVGGVSNVILTDNVVCDNAKDILSRCVPGVTCPNVTYTGNICNDIWRAAYSFTPPPGNWQNGIVDQCDNSCPVCGDGVIEYPEDCEQDSDCASGEICADCACVPEPVCGNGILEFGEECDDGNHVDGDGCSATCENECEPITGSFEITAPGTYCVTQDLNCGSDCIIVSSSDVILDCQGHTLNADVSGVIIGSSAGTNVTVMNCVTNAGYYGLYVGKDLQEITLTDNVVCDSGSGYDILFDCGTGASYPNCPSVTYSGNGCGSGIWEKTYVPGPFPGIPGSFQHRLVSDCDNSC